MCTDLWTEDFDKALKCLKSSQFSIYSFWYNTSEKVADKLCDIA
jgi:hypothetical protein